MSRVKNAEEGRELYTTKPHFGGLSGPIARLCRPPAAIAATIGNGTYDC